MNEIWAAIFGGAWEIAEVQMFGPILGIVLIVFILIVVAALIQGGVAGVKKLLQDSK